MFCAVEHFRSGSAVVDYIVFDAVFAIQYPLFDSFSESETVKVFDLRA